MPSTAEYWHIGAMTIRFGRVNGPKENGVNNWLMAEVGAICLAEVRVYWLAAGLAMLPALPRLSFRLPELSLAQLLKNHCEEDQIIDSKHFNGSGTRRALFQVKEFVPFHSMFYYCCKG